MKIRVSVVRIRPQAPSAPDQRPPFASCGKFSQKTCVRPALLRRSIHFLQPGEKLPNFPDNQIVQRNKTYPPLEFGERNHRANALDDANRGCQRTSAPSLTWSNVLTNFGLSGRLAPSKRPPGPRWSRRELRVGAATAVSRRQSRRAPAVGVFRVGVETLRATTLGPN